MNVLLMRCLGWVSPEPCPVEGQYLKAYDAETGESEWTLDEAEALTFESMAAAARLYRSVLPSDPIRAIDGQPNRPLTAFTVEVGQRGTFL